MDIFKDINFRYPFRDYQTRVLDQMQYMMEDNRLHVSAAPGAGKTVLGLETIKRLGGRALILVPTINLRNQWKDRFLELFIDDSNADLMEYWRENFSTDIKHPGLITCSTYQALYQVYSNVSEDDDTRYDIEKLIAEYKNLGVTTICLDEAHHLKREWWKALTDFVQGMDAKLIALTATPPMDTSDIEWKRYIQLCGEIDLEISIPEMVVKKCLSAHQDYLYICRPTDEEEAIVEKELARNKECETEILRNKELYFTIKSLPFLITPDKYMDIVFKCPDYISRIVRYAALIRCTWQVEFEGDRKLAENAYNSWDYRLQKSVEEEVNRIQDKNTSDKGVFSIQTEDDSWFLPFMKDILENDPEHFSDELKDSIKEVLTNNHLMKNGRIKPSFSTDRSDKVLRSSTSKLNAIVEIIRAESSNMGRDLRALVLMDHIRKEDLSKIETEEALTDLGVTTVFERLRRQEHLGNLENYFAIRNDESADADNGSIYRTRLGVLSGSLVILPDAAADKLLSVDDNLKMKMVGMTGYTSIEMKSDNSDVLVSEVTKLFQQGDIEILIGTSALLGEGWDAPAINTLIIGSNSGTYVKTNQMRGRAFRIYDNDENKVANIWHLMAISNNRIYSSELKTMTQRFDSIIGLSLDGKRIMNGLDRMKLEDISIYDSDNWNSQMLKNAADRNFVLKSWSEVPAIYSSSVVRNVVDIDERRYSSVNAFYGSLDREQMFALAKGIYSTLKAEGFISGNSSLQLKSERGRLEFYLDNASERDGRLYALSVKQALGPIINPRCMIRFGFLIKHYAPVPDVLGRKLKTAYKLRDMTDGAKEIIMVDNEKARKLVLKQRIYNGTAEREGVRVVKELI